MHISNVLVLAGALGAAAHPSGHAHLHRSIHAHEIRDKPKFYKAEKPHIPIPSSSAAPEPPAFTAAAAPKPKPKPKPKPAPEDQYIPFCGKNKKRVTEDQVHYTGNTGKTDNCEWNSNMMLVANSVADKYEYLLNFGNMDSTPYEVRCWNKIGEDGGLTGMFSVSSAKQLTFKIGPGETKYVAAAPNTQMVCAFAPGEVPLTEFGQYAGNWAEVDFENESNKGWSGADCSSLVAQHYDMDVPGCSMCEGGTCSKIYPGGRGVNAYTKGMEKLDGIGLNIPPGKVEIKVEVGFH